MDPKDILNLPKQFYMCCGWIEKIAAHYPRTARAIGYAVTIAVPVACALYWFCFCYPRQVIHGYLNAVNERNWQLAYDLIDKSNPGDEDSVAYHWKNAKDIEKAYTGFSGHENIVVSRPKEFPNVFHLFYDRIATCPTRLNYHVKLKSADFALFHDWVIPAFDENSPKHKEALDAAKKVPESCLWAQIKSYSDFLTLGNSNGNQMDVRIVNEREWTLRLQGLRWRITRFNDRVSDGLQWSKGS